MAHRDDGPGWDQVETKDELARLEHEAEELEAEMQRWDREDAEEEARYKKNYASIRTFEISIVVLGVFIAFLATNC